MGLWELEMLEVAVEQEMARVEAMVGLQAKLLVEQ
jgi:hypothetical protein